jgi:predicted ferric reductase
VSREAKIWLSAIGYLVVTLVPLFVVLLGTHGPQRGFWIEFAVALGFIGLAMLGLQSVLTARFPRISGALGQDALLQFHRQTGLVAFGLVLAHPVILLLADSGYWAFLDPTDQFLRAVFLILVLFALPLIIVTSLWRDQLRLPYESWRLGHGALAFLIVVIGLVHIMRVQYYLESGWKQALWVLIGTAAIGSVLYVRAIKPLQVRRYPYRVAAVEPLARETWRVVLEPEAGTALRFRAGQFAFVTIAESAFSLQQHPYSVASSARRSDRIELAIKELGDLTSTIGEVPAGARAYVDGPYGSLQLHDADEAAGAHLLLVAGGIGITPVMSMIRTLRDDRSTTPVTLVFANESEADIAYRDELDEIAREIPLTVVHVLARAPEGWAGETGFVTPELLARHVDAASATDLRCVVCGPPPMMEVVEQALVDLGVPLRQIESERFDIGAAGMIGRRAVGIRRMVIGLSVVMVAAAALFAA